MNEVVLGSRVVHAITGFTGIATGRAEYLSGCTTVLVKPKAGEDGKMPEGHWIDEDQLELVEASERDKPEPTGGPRPEEPPKH